MSWRSRVIGTTSRKQCHDTKPSGITSSLSAKLSIWGLYQLKAHTAVGDELLPDTCDVESFGDTTLLRRHAQGGHWRRTAHVTVLAKLFWDLGQQYTAQELVFWWIHAKKIVKKREHPTSSPERTEASKLKKEKCGGRGFSKYERPHTAVGDWPRECRQW